ncbi:hypothetical protein [Plasmodium yoelii yoelii]|uniref:Uncharacterized protein n=1 Tax=Plasmodium yoelii yoelii TaxID=73239 RepID=Q7RMS8_PLAYO|nr:hypothetical protein [Plasmodium yoelii yoelii]
MYVCIFFFFFFFFLNSILYINQGYFFNKQDCFFHNILSLNGGKLSMHT